MDLTNRALNAYAKNDAELAINGASPLQIIVMLYDGAINSLAAAKGKMQEMKLADKGVLISKAIGIIEGLRSVLDHEKGGEISQNLEDLYEYMKRRLAAANLKNEAPGLDEVIGLLGNLREAWVELETRERTGSAVSAKAAALAAATSTSSVAQAGVNLRA